MSDNSLLSTVKLKYPITSMIIPDPSQRIDIQGNPVNMNMIGARKYAIRGIRPIQHNTAPIIIRVIMKIRHRAIFRSIAAGRPRQPQDGQTNASLEMSLLHAGQLILFIP